VQAFHIKSSCSLQPCPTSAYKLAAARRPLIAIQGASQMENMSLKTVILAILLVFSLVFAG